MHLTNVAIQKTAEDYDQSAGCKWPLHSIKMYLMAKHGEASTNTLFNDIQEMIVRTLLSVHKVAFSHIIFIQPSFRGVKLHQSYYDLQI